MKTNQPQKEENNILPQPPSLKPFLILKLTCSATILILMATSTTMGLRGIPFWATAVLLFVFNMAAHLRGYGKGVQDALEHGYRRGYENSAQDISDSIKEQVARIRKEHGMDGLENVDEALRKSDIPKQVKLDALLDKISKVGMKNLTAEEKKELNELTK